VEGKEEEDHFDKALKMTLKQLVSLENIRQFHSRCLNQPGLAVLNCTRRWRKQQLTVKEQEEWELVVAVLI
jgi:proline dehydrogenase